MNKIICEHYPVADLPENLRQGLPTDASAVVTIEIEPSNPVHVPTLKELLSLRRPPYRTTEEIVEEIRRDRDEWDD